MRGAWFVAAGLALVALALLLHDPATPPTVLAQEPLTVVVTNAGDGPDAECPSDDGCTLRAAIELINGDAMAEGFLIQFSESLDNGDGIVIGLLDEPLPEVTAGTVRIDATAFPVVLEGSALEGEAAGLILAGGESEVQGLRVRGFGGACIVLAGPGARADGNDLGDCETGILVLAADATIVNNLIGQGPDSTRAPVTAGIRVQAPGTIVGGAGDGNVIRNASIGVEVGGGAGLAFNVRIGSNSFGSVATGVRLVQPSSGTLVRGNHFTDIAVAGIEVAPDAETGPVTGNTFESNTFESLSGVAIDLNADGVRNPNDEGDLDAGANGGINHPVIGRATQSVVTGSAGASCADCVVELYRAWHSPGGTGDYGQEPLARTTTNASGDFAFGAPAVTPAEWVIALVTDPDGNTSEFGPSARVGTGVVQCGNVTLRPGWNHLGYFGAGPLPLDDMFPEAGGGVSAIYRLDDGAVTYTHWIAGTDFSRTLTTLNPGESYWFYAEESTALPEGFALTVGLPVHLAPGWNDFTYIGGAGDVRDALASLTGHYSEIYHWANDGESPGWELYAPDLPAYARDFDNLSSCATYLVNVDAALTLVPLQP